MLFARVHQPSAPRKSVAEAFSIQFAALHRAEWLKSLRIQIPFALIVSMLITATIFSWYTINRQTRISRDAMRSEISILASSLGSSLSGHLLSNRITAIERAIILGATRPDIEQIVVFDVEGRTMAYVERSQDGEIKVRYEDAPHKLPQGSSPWFILDAETAIAWHPIKSGNILGWIVIVASLDSVDRRNRETLKAVLLIGGVSFLLSLIVLYFLLAPHAKYFDQLGGFALRLNIDRGTTLPVKHGALELKRLATALNTVSVKLAHQEREILERDSLFRSVVDHSPAKIDIKDVEGRYILINRVAEQIYGVTNEEAKGKTAREIFSKSSVNEFIEDDEAVRKTGKPVEAEEEWILEDKVHTFLTVKFPIYDASGTVSAIGAIGTDITERKALEERLRHAQKLEAVGQLTAGVAHEFNNILQGTAGYLEFLEEGIGDDVELRELVAGAKRTTWRAAKITKGLLAFGRRQVLRPRSIDLNDVISKMSTLLGSTSGRRIETKLTLADDLWTVKVDPGQLETAVVNLVLNARDAMPGGGALIIETANVHVDDDLASTIGEAEPGDYVKLSVSDSGDGMSAEVLEHAFEPFFTTKDVGKGTGLGLSMIYGFAQQSNGFVAIDSEVGRGTRVDLYLPRVSEPVGRGATTNGALT